MLDTFIQRKHGIAQACERVKDVQVPDPEYDFIVVGGGATGSVVAARLSENPCWKILLLESGQDEPAGASIPSFHTTIMQSSLEWGYKSQNESHACLDSNGSCSISAAKVLGGGMAHNSMIYLRGSPWIFDQWAAMGNEGWSWKEVLPFFKKAENNGNIDIVGRKYHSTDGPLFVEKFPTQPPFANVILEAAKEAGYVFTVGTGVKIIHNTINVICPYFYLTVMHQLQNMCANEQRLSQFKMIRKKLPRSAGNCIFSRIEPITAEVNNIC
ncbi:glucose dehydrogenase [FAD, quinone]-like [Diprion similis]|uniref:glucose dehydrogenase [FAD, quinone]-like n=1 Tax=Diprion similis TaxID=362088 RepID=UPI001EF82E59|nr:glucose dehydrogenase [FAD, quinone]-like [Diprion similis]